MKSFLVPVFALVACSILAAQELPNDGFIELPVAKKKFAEIAAKLQAIKIDPDQPFGNEGDAVFGIASKLAEPFYGRSQTMQIEGEGENPSSYTITYTDDMLLDDSTRAMRYEFVIAKNAENGGLILQSARAWVRPWPERYEGQAKYLKENKVEWESR